MKKILLFLFLFLIPIGVLGEGNYVTAIKVDGSLITGFSSDKTEYELNVPGDKNTIKIIYEYDHSMYSNQGGFGDLSLNYGKNEFNFSLTNINDQSDTKSYRIIVNREDSRDKDNSLKELMVGTNKVILSGDNEYTINVDSKTTEIDVTAKLSSDKASFVTGYGERTGANNVKLNGEITTIEIKVKSESEDIRTYKINIKKTDYKNNDATLKSIKIDKIDFNFKKDTLEYDLTTKYEIDKISIEAIPNDANATIEYDKTVKLESGINNIEIKVIAEDTKTTKTYKLNITREEEVPIISNITITGLDIKFDPKVYSYKVETDLDKLDFNVTLSNDTATSNILNNENLKNNSIVKIEGIDGDKKVTYSFKIISSKKVEEEKKEEEIDTKTTGNTKKNIFKDYEMIISAAILSFGLFSLIAAIVTKSKK